MHDAEIVVGWLDEAKFKVTESQIRELENKSSR